MSRILSSRCSGCFRTRTDVPASHGRRSPDNEWKQNCSFSYDCKSYSRGTLATRSKTLSTSSTRLSARGSSPPSPRTTWPDGPGGAKATALAGARATGIETHRDSRFSGTRPSMRQTFNNSSNNGSSNIGNGNFDKRPTSKRTTSGSSGIKEVTEAVRSKRVSLYSEPDSDSDDRSSVSTGGTSGHGGGGDGGGSCSSDDAQSDASSVPSMANVFGRSVTRAFAGAAGGGGDRSPTATDGVLGRRSVREGLVCVFHYFLLCSRRPSIFREGAVILKLASAPVGVVSKEDWGTRG